MPESSHNDFHLSTLQSWRFYVVYIMEMDERKIAAGKGIENLVSLPTAIIILRSGLTQLKSCNEIFLAQNPFQRSERASDFNAGKPSSALLSFVFRLSFLTETS